MPNQLTRCDCIVNCNHTYPEITVGTRYNHRKDDRINEIQATLARDNPARSHRHQGETSPITSSIMEVYNISALQAYPQSGSHMAIASSHHHPYPSQHATRSQHLPPPQPVQSSAHRPPDPHLSHDTHSNLALSRPLTGRTEAAIKLMESEIRTRHFMISASLATPLLFVNKPAEHGVYQHQTGVHLPNSGIYKLMEGAPVNANFLEQENRLWELIGLAHILPPCNSKTRLEERIWREIDRCRAEKELHWNLQRMNLDMDQVVVNNGE